MAPLPPCADETRPAAACGTRTPADALDALRAEGAHRSDPIGFRRLEVLATRAAQHTGGLLADALTCRFDAVLADYLAGRERARASADAMAAAVRARHPHAAPQLDEMLVRGDHRAFGRLAKRLQAHVEREAALAPLRALCRSLGQHGSAAGAPGALPSATPRSAAAPPELKVLRDSRATWARIAVDRQLSRSLQMAPPGQAGPLNSHALVLRALQQMNAIAPAYLEHFMSHIETLFWIDRAMQVGTAPASAARDAPQAEAAPAGTAARRPPTRRRSR